MLHSAALPFVLRRSDDVVGLTEITSTTETVHGLLRLEPDQLRVQWRVGRATERVGRQIRTDRELEAVREVVLPLSALASARVRWSWRRWPPGRRLVLTAADLAAFEQIAGAGGLLLDHPAELELRVPRPNLGEAREFCADLELALSELALRAAESRPHLASPPAERSLPPETPQ
jgi:hypothetical protein